MNRGPMAHQSLVLNFMRAMFQHLLIQCSLWHCITYMLWIIRTDSICMHIWVYACVFVSCKKYYIENDAKVQIQANNRKKDLKILSVSHIMQVQFNTSGSPVVGSTITLGSSIVGLPLNFVQQRLGWQKWLLKTPCKSSEVRVRLVEVSPSCSQAPVFIRHTW